MSTHVLDGAVFVSVTGELDLATAPVLADSVRNHDGDYESVVFDLSGLHFIDVSGLHALLSYANGKVQLSIRNPSDPARRLLDLAGRIDLVEEDPPGEALIAADE